MINFCKFQGFGNDYIVFEAEELKQISSVNDFAKKVCDRNYGIGGDGIAILERLKTETADYSCRIINPDGSEAGFSGNGTRCAVAYLHFKNLWREKSLRLQTKSGIKTYELLQQDKHTFWFLAELGKPKFDLPDTRFLKLIRNASEKSGENPNISGLVLIQEGIGFDYFYVDVGNPVVCIFVENFDGFVNAESEAFSWQQIGQKIESFEEMFPERTNVVFVRIIDKKNIEIKMWERGAGETSSSGTCSAAAAVAFLFRENARGLVYVHATGGATEVTWREDDEMLIKGRSDLVFCGEWI